MWRTASSDRSRKRRPPGGKGDISTTSGRTMRGSTACGSRDIPDNGSTSSVGRCCPGMPWTTAILTSIRMDMPRGTFISWEAMRRNVLNPCSPSTDTDICMCPGSRRSRPCRSFSLTWCYLLPWRSGEASTAPMRRPMPSMPWQQEATRPISFIFPWTAPTGRRTAGQGMPRFPQSI